MFVKRTLLSLIGGLAAGACVLLPSKIFSEQKKIMDAVYPVEMTLSSTGEKRIENLKIEAFVDDEKDELSFSFLTQNYNKKNWTRLEERIPAYQRYTEINGNTNVFVLRPELVTIAKMEQSVYVVPQNQIEKLSPMEDHPYMEIMFDLADMSIDWVEKWLVKELGIKSFKKIFDKMSGYLQKKEKAHQGDLQEKITPEGHILEQVLPYPVEAGKTETARFYNIYFNVPKTKRDIPISVLARIGLGRIEPEYSETPSWTGNLEDIAIEFNFSGKTASATTSTGVDANPQNTKTQNQPQQKTEQPKDVVKQLLIEDYFPRGRELERILPSSMTILGRLNNYLNISNPKIFSEKETKRLGLGIEGVLQKGMASYGILNDEGGLDQIGFYMEAYTFSSNKIPQDIKDVTKSSNDLGLFGLLADKTYVLINSLIKYGNYFGNKLATKRQALDYINFLIRYNERIKGELIFGEDKKGIKKIFMNSPEKLKDMINQPGKYGLYSSEEAVKYIFSVPEGQDN